MELSGKILREVEFRDRLRGYDTDEVDEFLERIAVGVDELRAEVAAAHDRAEQTERQLQELPALDDDSIRRTLVLAQRTADLAIKEATTEADRLIREATHKAEELLVEARDGAYRMRSEAEEELQHRVARLTEERATLERETHALTALVAGERHRLSQSLHSLLSYLDEQLQVSDALDAVVDHPSSEQHPPPPPTLLLPPADADPELETEEELDLSFRHTDVEREIAEDAALARPAAHRVLGEADPEAELWDRWARSGESESETADGRGASARPEDNWPA